MRKSISILCTSLLLCGSVLAQSTAPPSQDSTAHGWAKGNPLSVDEAEGLLIGRIEFAGNANTRDGVVRRAFGLREGAVLKRKHLRRGLGRLNRLGLFERIAEGDVIFRDGGESGQVYLLVVVKEREQR